MAPFSRRARATFAAAAAATLVLAACQALIGLERAEVSSGDAGAPEASGLDAEAGALDPCGDPPPRPPQEGVPGDLVLTFATAYVTLDVTKPDASTMPYLCPVSGMNLDGKDTCRTDDAGSCKNPLQLVCDLPGGVDESMSYLFSLLALGNVPQVDWNTPIRLGRAAIIFVITSYNGTPNDSEVGIATYMSTGLTALQPEAGPDGVAPADPPINYRDPSVIWDGSPGATWTPDVDSMQSGLPVYRSTGYVADGMLFASQAAVPVPFNGATIETTRIVAQLVQVGDAWALRYGRIMGSLRTRSILRGIASTSLNGHQLCDGQPSKYYALKSLTCNEADLRIEGNGGLCDGLSFAVGFVGVPAVLSLEPRRGPLTANVPCDGSFDDDCDFLLEAGD